MLQEKPIVVPTTATHLSRPAHLHTRYIFWARKEVTDVRVTLQAKPSERTPSSRETKNEHTLHCEAAHHVPFVFLHIQRQIETVCVIITVFKGSKNKQTSKQTNKKPITTTTLLLLLLLLLLKLYTTVKEGYTQRQEIGGLEERRVGGGGGGRGMRTCARTVSECALSSTWSTAVGSVTWANGQFTQRGPWEQTWGRNHSPTDLVAKEMSSACQP